MTTLENMDNMVETSNGMWALGTTLNECVNLFFQIGAMRGKSKKALLHLFSKAYNENPLVATKVLFWVRDVREGAGERQIFKDILLYLAENNTEVVKKNLSLIPEFGRWDDVLVLVGTSLEGEVFELIKTALNNGIIYQELLDNIDNYSEKECELILSYIGSGQNDASSLTHNLHQLFHNEGI